MLNYFQPRCLTPEPVNCGIAWKVSSSEKRMECKLAYLIIMEIFWNRAKSILGYEDKIARALTNTLNSMRLVGLWNTIWTWYMCVKRNPTRRSSDFNEALVECMRSVPVWKMSLFSPSKINAPLVLPNRFFWNNFYLPLFVLFLWLILIIVMQYEMFCILW